MNTWIFYGSPEQGSSKKTIHFIKTCKSPDRTKEYKTMQSLLENNTYAIVGFCTAKRWNEDYKLIQFKEYDN